MAFMMPVVKNDFNLYPSSNSVSSGRSSKNSSRSQSGASSMSSSPRGSGLASFMSSPRSSTSPAFTATPKCGSQSSLNKFHSRLLDRLRKTFKGKDDGETSSNGASRSSISPL